MGEEIAGRRQFRRLRAVCVIDGGVSSNLGSSGFGELQITQVTEEHVCERRIENAERGHVCRSVIAGDLGRRVAPGALCQPRSLVATGAWYCGEPNGAGRQLTG